MLKKYIALAVIIAMALPGMLAVLPATQGLPSLPDWDRDLLLGEAGAGAELSRDSQLHLVVSTFDPLVDHLVLPTELVTTRWDGLFLIQFIGPTLPSWTERVEDMGCRLVSYIPDNGYIAKMTPSARRDVVDLPYVRWVGPFHPGFRVLPETWTSPDAVMGLAVLAIDDPVELSKDISRLGGYLDAVGTHTKLVQALVPRAALLALARHPDVEWIEPWLVPAHRGQDDHRRTVGPERDHASLVVERCDRGVRGHHRRGLCGVRCRHGP